MTMQTSLSAQDQISVRGMQEADFWRVRDFLIETYPLVPPGYNWEIRRWDGKRFHNDDLSWYSGWMSRAAIFETADGRIVGAVHCEYEGDVHFEVHPDYRYLQVQMLDWAEEHLSVAAEDGRRKLDTFVFDYDAPRQRLLTDRGYENVGWSGVIRRLRFGNWPLPSVALPSGYTLRNTEANEGDYQRIADVLNAGFNRTIHNAPEMRNFMTQAPCFRHDLDLVAVAPDGSFAAYVGVIFEEVNRYGIFEPVCTHPDHRRKGLAQALMFEGLYRIHALGAREMYVDTGTAEAANALYESIGFTEAYKGYTWRRTF